MITPNLGMLMKKRSCFLQAFAAGSEPVLDATTAPMQFPDDRWLRLLFEWLPFPVPDPMKYIPTATQLTFHLNYARSWCQLHPYVLEYCSSAQIKHQDHM